MSIFLPGGAPKPKMSESSQLDALRVRVVIVYHPGYNPPKLMFMLAAYEAPSGQCASPSTWFLRTTKTGFFVYAAPIPSCLRPTMLPHLSPIITCTVPSWNAGVPYRWKPALSYLLAWTPPRLVPAHWVMGPICPSPAFTPSDYSTVVKTADSQCAVTGAKSRLENCHLVPEAEEPWWILRDINVLTQNHQGINSPPNCLSLRVDLHGAGMDKGDFVFAPYNGKMVCICLTEGLADFAADYHLRAVAIPARIHPLNLYVRFAWGLFEASQYLLGVLSDNPLVDIIEPELLNDGGDKKPGAERPLSDDDDDMEEYSDDAAPEPPLDVYNWTERDITFAEGLDAQLQDNPPQYEAAQYEVLDIYPGYSQALRLAHEYRQQHPEVSAVRSAR
ncbi:hypothetical protein C8F01DRAFT_1232773, partial [Mycena amicta]